MIKTVHMDGTSLSSFGQLYGIGVFGVVLRFRHVSDFAIVWVGRNRKEQQEKQCDSR
jgi:hypothetical protein